MKPKIPQILPGTSFYEEQHLSNHGIQKQLTLWIRHNKRERMLRKSGIFKIKKTDIKIGGLDYAYHFAYFIQKIQGKNMEQAWGTETTTPHFPYSFL
ncbi:MAG: hypothetical protein LBF28_02775, partial [Rickettsiales bacterium]|nr:hypothetical protein [Rickettsiales bacterium]